MYAITWPNGFWLFYRKLPSTLDHCRLKIGDLRREVPDFGINFSNTLFDPHLARSYNQLVLSALSLPADSILWNRVIEVKGERALIEFYGARH